MMGETSDQKNQLSNRIRAIWRRQVRPVWQDYQWAVLGGLVIATIILGGAYLALQLFHRQSVTVPGALSSCLAAVKFLATAVTLYATAKALAVIFQRQIQLVGLKLTKNHVVICGLGDKGSLFTKAFYEDGYKVVGIDKDADNSRLEQFRDLGILILTGNATDSEILQKARVQKARYLVAVCGNDGDNAEIAVNASALVAAAETKVLTCLVHITNPHLCNLLKEREIMAQRVDSFRMEFFNVYESGARQLLKEFPGFDESVGNFEPHLLIVGLGAMGKSLTVHAATLWRIALGKSKKKLLITLVDKDADQKKEYLQLQYPQLNDCWDLIPVTLEIDSPQFYQAKFLRDGPGRGLITMVYVCLDEDSRSLAAALVLFQHLRHEEVPIVVQLDHDAGLATLLQGEDSGAGGFANLHSFGLLDRKCKTDLLLYGTHEILARAIHQDYLWSQKNLGLTLESNPSLVTWDELPETLKESNRRQADDIGRKLTMVHCEMEPLMDWDAELFEFTPEEIEILARREHQRWLTEHINEGWTYDPGAKNPDRKTSPLLLDWDELPEDFKRRNRDETRRLPSFLAKAGFQIFRTGPNTKRLGKNGGDEAAAR
ncbi:MAG: NAD-binding protein [Deltaproteobacteria bacterium]|nr:NAD-binding protein [Deltaproteobacteria bacterium]